uniref:Major facilitator superfamily protein n=1 Tax=Zea mays TaxID=4577 RepID=A0A804MHB5_MAIZE
MSISIPLPPIPVASVCCDPAPLRLHHLSRLSPPPRLQLHPRWFRAAAGRVTSAAVGFRRASMCVVIFIGTNGQTYFITASLVTSIQNFPKSRGPTVGILKGFMGLTSAILTQVYTVMHTPDHAALIFMVAVGPSLVAIGLMFVIRPVGGHRQIRPSDKNSFMFIYTVCLLLASYLVGAMLVQDFLQPSYDVVVFLTVILFVLLISPIAIPVIVSFMPEKAQHLMEDALLSEPLTGEASSSRQKEDQPEVILSEVEEEKSKETDSLPPSERRKRIAELQAKLVEAAARGGVRIKRRPHRGDNFTLMQALVKADFWLIWLSLLLGSGSGLTVIDNLGQMSQAIGYKNAHIFVSLVSIWNFLGRVGGGYFSEIIVRERTYPRHIALAVAQIVMAAGHFLFAMAWPGTMYIASLLVGLGYGAHWAIVPAAVSELFGVKHFGAMYNFLILANPAGSLIFSELIVSNLYEHEAEKQASQHQMSALLSPRLLRDTGFLADDALKCEGPACFFFSSLIMSVFCAVAAGLSLLVVQRTRQVYPRLYSSVRT